MKKIFIAVTLSLHALQADPSFVMTNQAPLEESVSPLTTTEGEYETLFEMVDIAEASLEEEVTFIPETVIEPLVTKEPELLLLQDNPPPLKEVAFLSETTNPLPLSEALPAIQINFREVFTGSPLIYTLLLTLSILALFIGLYSHIHIQNLTNLSIPLTHTLRNRLTSNQFEEALSLCRDHENLFCKMIASGLAVRKYGLPTITETMKAEGKRSTVKFWQKLSLLNDIAVIAPMVGLLGTVLGMFYAFYDVNRSLASVSALFSGLGVSVGTTLAGLLVAIFALILHSLARYRVTKRLVFIENQVHTFAPLIDQREGL